MKTKLVFIYIVHLNCHMQIIIPRWMAVFLSLLPLINDNNETRFSYSSSERRSETPFLYDSGFVVNLVPIL